MCFLFDFHDHFRWASQDAKIFSMNYFILTHSSSSYISLLRVPMLLLSSLLAASLLGWDLFTACSRCRRESRFIRHQIEQYHHNELLLWSQCYQQIKYNWSLLSLRKWSVSASIYAILHCCLLFILYCLYCYVDYITAIKNNLFDHIINLFMFYIFTLWCLLQWIHW